MPMPIKDADGNVILGDDSVLDGAFTATGASSTLRSVSAGPISILLHGTFSATVDFEKSYDGGTTWLLVKSYSAIASEIYEEVEAGVSFRLNCSAFTSGSAGYHVSAGG